LAASDWRKATIALLAIFAVGVLLRSQIAAIPLERDEGEYAYIAQRWLNGEIPYKEAFDQKPPGVFAAYAVIQSLFGESPKAIHWGMQLYTLATLTCVFFLGWRLYSFTPGACAACLCAFMISNACVLGNSANTEVFMILPMTGALLTTLIATKSDSLRWGFVSGVLAMSALLFKQVAFPNFIFSALCFLLVGKRRWRLAGSFLGGAIVMFLPVGVYFVAENAWREFYDCVLGLNLRYASRLPLSAYPASFWLNFRPILAVNWAIYLLAGIGSVWVIGRYLRPPRGQSNSGDLLIVVWLLFCAWGVSTGGYFRKHYFVQALPAVSLLAAAGIARITFRAAAPRRSEMLAYLLSAVAITIGVVAESWYYLPGSPEAKCRTIYGAHPFPESQSIADYLAKHSTADDTIFIFGSEPQILYHAHRKSASRYFFLQPVMLPTPEARGQQLEILEQLRLRPPKFILAEFVIGAVVSFPDTPFDLFEGVPQILRNSYHVVGAVLGKEDAAGSRKLWTESQVVQLWDRAPYWYTMPPTTWWAVVVIWERNPNMLQREARSSSPGAYAVRDATVAAPGASVWATYELGRHRRRTILRPAG
jgi:hypothetical protein